MKIQYRNYEIELIDDRSYSIKSVDNLLKYDYEYFGGQINKSRIYPINKRGLRVKDIQGGEEVSSAILCENGGRTEISDQIFKIGDDKIWIAVGDMIYALKLPDLEISWFNPINHGTIYSINYFKEDFIVLGDLGATRLSKDGALKWQFVGDGIFIPRADMIKVGENQIELIDGNNQKYLLDEHGSAL